MDCLAGITLDDSLKPKESAEYIDLKDHHNQIKRWMNSVQKKIFELETTYLEDTYVQGNIVKGWELDGRPPLKQKPQIEDKERLFSLSSYEVWLENKNQQEAVMNQKAVAVATGTTTKYQKKGKKRKTEVLDEWTLGMPGDY